MWRKNFEILIRYWDGQNLKYCQSIVCTSAKMLSLHHYIVLEQTERMWRLKIWTLCSSRNKTYCFLVAYTTAQTWNFDQSRDWILFWKFKLMRILRWPKANLGQTTTRKTLRGRGTDRTQLFECKPKESSNGEPPGAGLHTIYTTIHEGCARLSIGLCTVHDIIVELGARLYDIKGGSVHSMRHMSRLR